MNEYRRDHELLREFARRGDQAAFATVVHRHLDLVFATAFRKLDDAGAAEEVAQDVFAALARNGWRFGEGDSVPAWLHRATLLKAKGWWRGELRHRQREQIAVELGTTMNAPDSQAAIRPLLPLLDEALLALREKDRTALLLRFYERQPFRDIGATLGVGEDAAQKRVTAALEKLAQFFRRRGFRTATAGVTAAALQHGAISAPAALASAMAQTALAASPSSLMALASHVAALGKLPALCACVAMAAIPLAWEWHGLKSAESDAAQARTELHAVTLSLTATQADSNRLEQESRRLDAAISIATEAQNRNAQALSRLGDLKDRLHQLLATAEPRWPEELPYARVPRNAVDNINPGRLAIDGSGKLSDTAAQLLGLTPQERAFTESHLAEYLQSISDLASRHAFETNSRPQRDGWVTKTIFVPASGQEREALWYAHVEPVQEMLGFPRRNQLSSFWMESLWCGTFYPWCYDDSTKSKLSDAQFELAVQPDGTAAPRYSLYHVGHTVQTGNLPFRGTLPGFLRERFKPWLHGLGIYDIETGQP